VAEAPLIDAEILFRQPGPPQAITVTRDQATITANANWKHWATKQARLLKAKLAPEIESQAAEIILECGGDSLDLKIVKHGEEWLSQKELLERLTGLQKLRVRFGHLEHSGEDSTSQQEFNDEFQMDEDLMLVPEYDGRVRGTTKNRWNDFNQRTTPYRITTLFNDILKKVWKDYEEGEDFDTVGFVVDIETSVKKRV
jgi:hypothetical protein